MPKLHFPRSGPKAAGAMLELAQKVDEAFRKKNDFRFIYDTEASVPQKIEAVAREIYGADGVDFTAAKRICRRSRAALTRCRSAWPRRSIR